MPFIQNCSHITPNHPLSFLQHQLFCCGMLTLPHLGARQISACESLDSSSLPEGVWGVRWRGNKHIKPRICYHQSLTPAHAKTRVAGGRRVGKVEGKHPSHGDTHWPWYCGASRKLGNPPQRVVAYLGTPSCAPPGLILCLSSSSIKWGEWYWINSQLWC